jgi:hypothetical protein
MYTKEFEEGYVAFIRNQDTNPYDFGTPEYDAWEQGWNRAFDNRYPNIPE